MKSTCKEAGMIICGCSVAITDCCGRCQAGMSERLNVAAPPSVDRWPSIAGEAQRAYAQRGFAATAVL
jgi:hypothetical protein